MRNFPIQATSHTIWKHVSMLVLAYLSVTSTSTAATATTTFVIWGIKRPSA
jgi:hypothetical protein